MNSWYDKKNHPIYAQKNTIESLTEMDDGGISPKLNLSYILSFIVWALLYPFPRMFSSVNPRAEFTRPLPSAKSRTIQECHPASLHPQDQRKVCHLKTMTTAKATQEHMQSQKFLWQWTNRQGYTSVCKLTTHLWPSYKPDVREISTWEAKANSHCWYLHSFVNDTALCCTQVVAHR